MDNMTDEQRATVGAAMREAMAEKVAAVGPGPIITITRAVPHSLRIKGVIRCPRALTLARQAVEIGTAAWWESDGPDKERLAARARARFDWASDREKAWLLRRKRRAQAALRKRARNLRRKAR